MDKCDFSDLKIQFKSNLDGVESLEEKEGKIVVCKWCRTRDCSH